MKFGYFCNTTNWNHKPYNQLLEETKEITTFCDQNNWTQFGIPNTILIMREWSRAQTH